MQLHAVGWTLHPFPTAWIYIPCKNKENAVRGNLLGVSTLVILKIRPIPRVTTPPPFPGRSGLSHHDPAPAGKFLQFWREIA